MSSSGLSSPLTTPPMSEEEKLAPIFTRKGKKPLPTKRKASPSSVTSSPKRKRSPSPAHEFVLADNPDIAFIVMFRSRFTDAFSPKMSHFGPQDIEQGVVDSTPSPLVESLLCALLGLALNRKKPVERGHYGRALEDAISTNKTQWPLAWEGRNPLNGNQSFATMNPQQRLTLLKALILWSLNGSDAISQIIKDSYKQNRHDDDLNQPLSVHAWGKDGYKRRYWLIEGKDDTSFRLYRESNPALRTNTWWSVAGTIEEMNFMAAKLIEDDTQAARRLAGSISQAIPRFEATEDKRRKREYRMQQKARFSRPEPGFSMYEGRTRGRRTKYTFSEDEDDLSLSDVAPRRSTRRGATDNTAAGADYPTVTASGRTVRSRVGGAYGEKLHSGQTTGVDTPMTNEDGQYALSEEPGSGGIRGTRSGRAGMVSRNQDVYDSEEEEAQSSGNEWDGGDEDEPDNEEEDQEMELDDEDISGDELVDRSLVVTLRVGRPSKQGTPAPVTQLQSPATTKTETTTNSESKIPPAVAAAQSEPHTNGIKDDIEVKTEASITNRDQHSNGTNGTTKMNGISPTDAPVPQTNGAADSSSTVKSELGAQQSRTMTTTS